MTEKQRAIVDRYCQRAERIRQRWTDSDGRYIVQRGMTPSLPVRAINRTFDRMQQELATA